MKRKPKSIDCKEFTRLMPLWLSDELKGRKAYQFLEHMDTCGECREELHIQFLVIEGTARLESAASFNLDEELDNKVRLYREKLNSSRILNGVIYTLEAISVAILVWVMSLVIATL